MARTSDRKTRGAASSGAALAAVMLGSAGIAAHPVPPAKEGQPPTSAERGVNWEKMPGQARTAMTIKLKNEYRYKGEYSVAGEDGGRIIFEDDRGNLFYVDEATGDQKFVKGKVHVKVELDNRRFIHHSMKMRGRVTILGVDEKGRLIMRDKKGEAFHLDPATGDMVFVK